MVGAAVREGAVATIGGKRAYIDGRGHFYPPTVLINVTPSMSCGREEIFGPVAPIIKYACFALLPHHILPTYRADAAMK